MNESKPISEIVNFVITNCIPSVESKWPENTKNNRISIYYTNLFIQPKFNTYKDANVWIQKILLEEKYGKINS